MPGDGVPEGSFTQTELGELAELFDRFHFAFDPTDQAAAQAEEEFSRRVRDLFDSRIQVGHPHMPFDVFVGRLRACCWDYLKKNKP
jgi:hypothetical protein